jgi:transglutaminase-like putative cysteine protease
MKCETDAWAIRSIPRKQIIDYLLVYHCGLAFEELPEADARAELEAAIDRWLGLGLGFATAPDGEPLFDPVETLNFLVAAGRRDDDDYWQKHYVASGRRRIEAMQPFPEGGPAVLGPRHLAPRRYRIRLERDYGLDDLAAGTRVRLRLPLPIEDHALRDLSLELDVPADATIRQESARLDASFALATPGIVTLAATASFEARADAGSDAELSEDQRTLYTRPREDLICVSERARAEAEAITSGWHDDRERVDAIFGFFLDRLAMGGVPYHALDPDCPSDWPFTSGFFDCQIGAALFCAMCRAVGIPARLCSGYQLYATNMGYHYWAQAWIQGQGWLSFDLSAWHLSSGGRDRSWAQVLSGWLDHRLKVQVLPTLFTGPSTKKFPAAWHMLVRRLADGTETSFVDARSGALIYRDRVTAPSA